MIYKCYNKTLEKFAWPTFYGQIVAQWHLLVQSSLCLSGCQGQMYWHWAQSWCRTKSGKGGSLEAKHTAVCLQTGS